MKPGGFATCNARPSLTSADSSAALRSSRRLATAPRLAAVAPGKPASASAASAAASSRSSSRSSRSSRDAVPEVAIVPPPSTVFGERRRTTYGAPGKTTAGARSESRPQRSPIESGTLSKMSVPRISAEPIYARTGVRRLRIPRATGRGRKRTSVSAENSELESTTPRAISATSTPGRLAATRDPPSTRSRFSPKTCRLRRRTSRPAGASLSTSPTAMRPCISVPVTIVPCPGRAKTRSIGRYGGASGARRGRAASAS